MNVFDKNLLFEMSYALMRRFAFIDVEPPSDSDFRTLIEAAANDDAVAVEVTTALMSLRGIGDKDIGPAMFMDIARYVHERLIVGDAPSDVLLSEAFYSYLLPQFEGISDDDGVELNRRLRHLILGREERDQIRRTLNTVLGLQLSDKGRPGRAVDDDDDDQGEDEAADDDFAASGLEREES